MANRYVFVLVVLLGAHLSLSASTRAQAQSPPFKPVPLQPFTQPSLGISMDYPRKEWQVLAVGAGSSVVLFFQTKGEASVAVEALTRKPIARENMTDFMAGLEIDDWKLRRPLATAFSHQFIDVGANRAILIDFTQPGPRGLEHGRMYTLPLGAEWYRVICTTPPTYFEKYKQVFHAMALSLKTTSSP